jgi:hypothetical protein
MLGALEILYSSRTKIEYARASIQLAQGVFLSAIIAFHEGSLRSGGQGTFAILRIDSSSRSGYHSLAGFLKDPVSGIR